MRSVVLIPARYGSTRYPGKPLVELLGKPLIIWVCEVASLAVGRDDVYVATDDQRIADVVTEHGFNYVMTEDALTGTDRLYQAAVQLEADIYINVQGDEPLVDPADILKVIDAKKAMPNAVINGYAPLADDEDPHNVNIPKVALSDTGRLIYASRAPVPAFKDAKYQPATYYKQVCIYAFNREELIAFGSRGQKSQIEQAEDIEILRFLDFNHPIQMVPTKPGSYAVDHPDDVALVESKLRQRLAS
ncbi:MAG: 3-deoxy-manno-octulosonate cytidylyltransferase [Gammaproteobacteria bacterium]|nr:3-deoxy-manno-octulosonate cytidylyltransferase [Gammaproteobacteria bacterium]